MEKSYRILMKNKTSKEALEQEWLMNWCRANRIKYPELELLFHVPNGGSRNTREAINLKKQGVKPGVPDLFLPVARGKYHGLFIEMKATGNKCTDFQEKWIKDLVKENYCCVVAYGWEVASIALMEYLEQ